AVVHAPDVDVPLDPADERVQGRSGIGSVETEVAGDVVARAERDTHERKPALDRDVRDRCEGAVTARDPERVAVRGAGELGDVLSLAEEVRRDAALRCCSEEVVRAAVARAGVDEQEGPQGGPFLREKMGRTAHVNVRRTFDHPDMEARGILHRIEDDLSETWVEDLATDGVQSIEAYLAKHLAFLSYL